jgi:hypothetical protein
MMLLLSVLVTVGLAPGPAHAAGSMFKELIFATDSSARLDLLYTNQSNKTVMQYDVGWPGKDRVYYTDGTDGKPLFGINATLAYALAHTPYLNARFAKEHGLSILNLSFLGLEAEGLLTVKPHDLGAPMCQWPYRSAYTITSFGKPTIDVMFLRRLEVPRTSTYQLWCERGPGETRLETEFETLGAGFAVDAHGAPLLAFESPAVVFRYDSNGTLLGPRLGAGILVAPAALSRRLLEKVAEDAMSPADAIREFNADIVALKSDKNRNR